MFIDLPQDILLVIAGFCSVADIIHLSQSCRFVHAVMDQRTVWYRVILDILSQVPDIQIAKKLPSASASELRKTALQIYGVERRFDLLSSERTLQARLIEFDEFYPPLDVALVPGGEYIVAFMPDRVILLLSAENAHEVARYFHPGEVDFGRGKLQITSSSQHGIVLQILADHATDDEPVSRELWYLHIDTSTPAIIPLLVNPVDRIIDLACFHEDTFATVCMENDRKIIRVQNIKDTDLGGIYYLGEEKSDKNICHIVLDSDLLLVFLYDGIDLYSIPPPASILANENPRPLEHIWAAPLHVRDSLFVSPRPRTGTETSEWRISTFVGGRHLTIYASKDPRWCGIADDTGVFDINDAISRLSIAKRRTVAIGHHDDAVRLVTSKLPWAYDGNETANWRLNLGNPGNFGASEIPTGSYIPGSAAWDIRSVAFDEWTGRVCLYIFCWDEECRDEEELITYVAIVDI